MPDVNAPMMVIRKRLSASEISNPDFRLEDDVVQQTGDGGTTWVDSPANDVRHAPAWRLPPIVADDQRCQAAANMTRFLVNWFEELLPILSAAGSAWALLSTLILLFVVLGPFALVVIMLDVAATLLGIGATAIGSAFTTEVFDTLTCIFYCRIDEEGQVSAEQLAQINSDVDDQIGGTAATVLHVIFALVGEVGVSNWGARGDAPADCDACDCGWTYCWLSGDGLGDWVTPWSVPIGGGSYGDYNSGDDSIDGTLKNLPDTVWANFALTEALDINGILITYEYNNSAPLGDNGWIMWGNGDQFEDGLTPEGSGTAEAVWEGDGSGITSLEFLFASSGTMKITQIKLAGTGTPPSSGVPCE